MVIKNEILSKIILKLKKAKDKPPYGITISGLSREIGVSRTVVRMHLIVLETKGLVESTRVQNALIFYLAEKR